MSSCQPPSAYRRFWVGSSNGKATYLEVLFVPYYGPWRAVCPWVSGETHILFFSSEVVMGEVPGLEVKACPKSTDRPFGQGLLGIACRPYSSPSLPARVNPKTAPSGVAK